MHACGSSCSRGVMSVKRYSSFFVVGIRCVLSAAAHSARISSSLFWQAHCKPCTDGLVVCCQCFSFAQPHCLQEQACRLLVHLL